VLKFVYDRFDVAGHRDVDIASFVVLVDGETAVLGAGPVRHNLIQVDKAIHQVFGVLVANSFDAEVVDDEAKLDWSRSVAPEAVGMFGEMVAVLSEVLDGTLLGDSTCLGKVQHAFVDFDEDVAVVD
jgi:hypothetical protein